MQAAELVAIPWEKPFLSTINGQTYLVRIVTGQLRVNGELHTSFIDPDDHSLLLSFTGDVRETVRAALLVIGGGGECVDD